MAGRRDHRIRRSQTALLVAGVLCLAVTRQASGAGPLEEFDRPNVLWYERPAVRRGVPTDDYRITRGERTLRDGCVTEPPTLSATAADGEIIITAKEVAFDPATCRSLYSVSERSPRVGAAISRRARRRATIAAEAPGTTAEVGGGEVGANWGGTNAGAAAVQARRVATGYSAWEDPAQLDVNKVQDSVNFRSSSNCASYANGSLWDRLSWRTGTGWSKLYRDKDTYVHCDRVAIATYGRFNNYLFCNPFSETRTRMWPNRVEGFPGGRTDHEPNGMSKTGDCAGLLHTETRLSVAYTADASYKGF